MTRRQQVGRVNLYIDGERYGPGIAIEIGQRAAVAKFAPGDGTLRSGQQRSVVVGEAVTLDAAGTIAANAAGRHELDSSD